MRLLLALLLVNAILADCAGVVLDEIAIARDRLQQTTLLLILSVHTRLFALLHASLCFLSTITMCVHALLRSFATIARSRKCVVDALGLALSLIELQRSPQVRVVVALGGGQFRVARREEANGLLEQIIGARVCRLVAVKNALE